MFFGRHRSVYKVCRYFFFFCWLVEELPDAEKWGQMRNISDTAVFSGKKGCFYGNRTIFACKFYLLYICRYLEPPSQIDNTKACIAVSRGIEVHGRFFFLGWVRRGSRRRGSLSIHPSPLILTSPPLNYFSFFKLQVCVSFSFGIWKWLELESSRFQWCEFYFLFKFLFLEVEATLLQPLKNECICDFNYLKWSTVSSTMTLSSCQCIISLFTQAEKT